MYAIGPDGIEKWSFIAEGDTSCGLYSSPAVGADGTIYVGIFDKLYAINPDGTEKWSFIAGDCVGSSPAIGSDGTVYVGSDDYNLYAINPDGTEKWSFTTGAYVVSSPAIGSDGTVYVGSYDHNLYAINPDGTEKWSFTTGDSVLSSPAIGSDGTVYVGSYDKKLYAINSDGTLKWNFTTGDCVYSSPAIGSDGTIYIASFDAGLYGIGEATLPPDTTPPIVSSVSPEDGYNDVPIDTVVTATFSETMDETTINGTSFTLAGSAIAGTVTYDPATCTATFTPDANLEYDHTYTATLSTAITDLVGNPLTQPYAWNFTTTLVAPNEWVEVTSQSGIYICNDSVDFRFERDLTVGSIGDDVKYLQILLNSNPLTQLDSEGAGSPGRETNNFGSITEAAVRKFQSIRSLTENGIVAGDTRSALNELLQEYAPVKHVPNGWLLRVIDTHENFEMHDSCICWEIEDATDGIRGWVPYKNNIDSAIYLEAIGQDVGEQRTQEISSVDARKFIIVDAVKNRAALFNELSSFPSELLLAIVAGEMPSNADNTYISFDCGRGISQITSNEFVGSYSGVKCYGGTTKGYMPYEFVYPFDRSITQVYWTDRGCQTGSYQGETTYRDCNCKEEQECEGEKAWYYGGTDTSGRCRYYSGCDDGCRVYTNTVQGIDANLKDGKGALKDYYVDSIGKNENTESNFKFTTQLKKEDRGKEVAYLQCILKSEISQDLPVTAYFGSMTEQALKDFQAREFPDKQPSGIVDPDIKNLLNTLLDNTYSYLRNRVEEIKSWVGATWRYNHGHPDGTIKSDTRNYLFNIATRLETLNSYFPDYETQLGNDLLDEADRQLLLSVMKYYQYFEIRSPIELRIYDSQGNVTGVIEGQVYDDIPDSTFDEENEVVLILLPLGVDSYEVVGIDEGSYGLEGGSIQDGTSVTFSAVDIPILVGAVHRFTIDWDAVSRGEEGVTVQVDSDGDGTFERTFMSDGELTRDEFIPRSDCFIATAAYGTPMAEEIQILRDFRDEYLLASPVGQTIVDLYYRTSPPIAEFITDHPRLKPIVRVGLLPAVAMSAVVVNTTMVEKMAALGLLALVSVTVAIWVTRRRGRGVECT